LPTTPTSPQLDRGVQNRATAGILAGGSQVPISRIDITGNTVIPADELRAIVAPYQGQSLTLFEIYSVADELTQFYRAQGYSVASVTVPVQKNSSGTVKLEVMEGGIGAISIRGSKANRAIRVCL